MYFRYVQYRKDQKFKYQVPQKKQAQEIRFTSYYIYHTTFSDLSVKIKPGQSKNWQNLSMNNNSLKWESIRNFLGIHYVFYYFNIFQTNHYAGYFKFLTQNFFNN